MVLVVAKSSAGQASSGTQNAPSIVAACCARAIAQGVRPGMPSAEAEALLKKGSELFSGHGDEIPLPRTENSSDPFFTFFRVYEPAADRRALVQLAEACERFSPRVAVEEGEEPESLLLDISNLEHLYGSEAKLVGRVEKFFVRRGYRVRLAAGETVGAAWAAAHCGGNPNDECRMTNEGTRDSSFPIEALRIPDDTTALLRELGIQTIDQLLALPRDELAPRFGEELLRRLDQLTGQGRELIEPHRGLPALAASYALEEPTGDRDTLMHVLKQLADRLSRQLAARDQGAVVLVCLLHLVGGTPGVGDGRGEPMQTTPFAEPQGVPPRCLGIVPLRIGLLEPSANARQILELIELHLETVRLADEVDRVELRAVVTGRLGERQRELFDDRWLTDPHQLAVLVNRLSSRLGSERVLRAELRKSPAPERSVKWTPSTEKRIKKLQNTNWKTAVRKRQPSAINNFQFSIFNLQSRPRPLVLYPTPRAMEVVCVSPDGTPQFVWEGNHREQIVSCVGPERIETLWWCGPSMRRDYYRVATQSGGHLWMFRRLADGKWFLHGEFA